MFLKMMHRQFLDKNAFLNLGFTEFRFSNFIRPEEISILYY